MVEALGILEVSGVLGGISWREARAALFTALTVVAERRLYLFLVLVGWVGQVLRPERWRRSILEDKMRRHVCKDRIRWSVRRAAHRHRGQDDAVFDAAAPNQNLRISESIAINISLSFPTLSYLRAVASITEDDRRVG